MNVFVQRGLPASSIPAVRTISEGVPIYSFGYTDIYGEAPLLTCDTSVQAGSDAQAERIHLKKSWEIRKNYIGANPPRMPRIPENDIQPLECVNLIDGSDETCWSSRFHAQCDELPAPWIRIDLARECVVSRIVLRKRRITFRRWQKDGSRVMYPGAVEVGRAMPEHVTIRAAADAYTWDVLYDNETGDTTEKDEFTCVFSPKRYKQFWIMANRLVRCEDFLYTFSVASVEIYDMVGRNIALVSRGAGATASSVYHGPGCERELHHQLWPVHLDLGLKYSRVGYHDDPINWHHVETQKGILNMDSEAEQAINLLTANGVDIIYTLAFGNRLYQKDPARHLPQLWEWYYENPEPPKTEEAFAAWLRFVSYSVNYYKDRVCYFEIWNEWNISLYWGDTPDTALYLKLAHETIRIIREIAPGAKVIMGSYAGFPSGISGWDDDTLRKKKRDDPLLMAVTELAGEVDIIGVHPFYQPDYRSFAFQNYDKDFRAFKRFCETCGFAGKRYMASEYNFGANYPPIFNIGWGDINYTEIQKAKLVAQFTTVNTALGVESMFCELWSNSYSHDLSLMRRSFEGYPLSPVQPQAAYYVLRNLCTILDTFEPAEFVCDVSECDTQPVCHTFTREGGFAAALWYGTHVDTDDTEPTVVTLMMQGKASAVYAYDCMNGLKTTLLFEIKNGNTLIRGLKLRDFPCIIFMDV